MKILDFLRETTRDHRTIKAITKGTIPLKSQQLSEGYKKFIKFTETNTEMVLSSEEARSFLDRDLYRKAFTLKDAIHLQLDFYEKFKNDIGCYFYLTPFISNFYNLIPIGVHNRNLDRIEGFDYSNEDLSLQHLFKTPISFVGALSPDDPQYRFYAGIAVVEKIFEKCNTPFEVLTLASRIIDDNYLVHVQRISKSKAKLEWFLPRSNEERKAIVKRLSTVDIGAGEYFSLKSIISKVGKKAFLTPRLLPAYTADVLETMTEVVI